MVLYSDIQIFTFSHKTEVCGLSCIIFFLSFFGGDYWCWLKEPIFFSMKNWGDMFYQFQMQAAQNCITFHVLLQIIVIKQANSLLQPALKFVHDRNMQSRTNFSAGNMRYNAKQFGV